MADGVGLNTSEEEEEKGIPVSSRWGKGGGTFSVDAGGSGDEVEEEEEVEDGVEAVEDGVLGGRSEDVDF